MSYVCPFGIYCKQGHNKKWQPNKVCYYFFLGKCTEQQKIYEKVEVIKNAAL